MPPISWASSSDAKARRSNSCSILNCWAYAPIGVATVNRSLSRARANSLAVLLLDACIGLAEILSLSVA